MEQLHAPRSTWLSSVIETLAEGTTMQSDKPITEDPLVTIVDDDPSVAQSARRLVGSLGHRAEAFGSAEEFLDSGRATKTACLILDVRMSGMDGLGLQRLLADRGLRIPIVFITARATDDEECRALRAGAIAFLRKPVDKDSLARLLEAALAPSANAGGNRHDDQRS